MKTPIFGFEGYVNGNGEIRHRTVIVGYYHEVNQRVMEAVKDEVEKK
jgi:hypothetical protein